MFAEGFRDKIFDTEIVAVLVQALGDTDSDVRRSAVNFFTVAIAQGTLDCSHRILILTIHSHDGFRDKIFDAETVAHLIEAQLTVEFWSHGLNSILLVIYVALIFICIEYIHPRAYNHFITSTFCEQLTSADLSLRDQTRCLISEAIKHSLTHFSLYFLFLIYK
jgi:hypothetical protein